MLIFTKVTFLLNVLQLEQCLLRKGLKNKLFTNKTADNRCKVMTLPQLNKKVTSLTQNLMSIR